jgi:predicted ribosomally synthesized peptide with SipW-like signal peptide
MKKKALLSSILMIVLCLSLIAGSTFALFTSQSQVSIAVTAGEVDMVAGIAITKLESVAGDANGNIVDEYGNTYSFVDRTAENTFTNGGTAVIVDSVLTMQKVTPGDKITFEISGTNTSNVAIQYRYTIECLKGDDLMKGLEFTVNGAEINKYMKSYTSVWTALEVGTSMANVPVSIELPVTAGNEFELEGTEIRVLVEAVQGNAVVDTNTEPVITYYNTAATADEVAALIADPYVAVIDVTDSFAAAVEVGNLSGKTINANGNNATFKFTGKLDNVVINGIVDNGDATPAIQFAGATGNVTITNSTLVDESSQPYGAVAGGNADLAVTIEDCVLSGARPVYCSGAVKSLTIKNCEINNTSSWAILFNSAVYGDIVIDGCTFNGCVGLFKATGAINGNFTFTNNTINDCTTKNGVYVEAKVTGTITVSGNTMTVAGVVDDDVTAAELLGIVKL